MKQLIPFFLAFLPILAQDAQKEGLRIATLLDAANNGFIGEYTELEMVLINAHGDSTTRKINGAHRI